MIEGINKRFSVPLARKLASVSFITPHRLTFMALFLSLAGAYAVISSGAGPVPALLFLLSNFLDSLDGDLARVRGEASKEGAFLDAVFDRASDLSMLFALGYDANSWFWCYLAVTGSVLVPYARAKAEVIGKGPLPTFGSRGVRNAVIFIGLLTGASLLTLQAVALLSLASAAHRIWQGVKR